MGRVLTFNHDVQKMRRILDDLVEAADREADRDNAGRLRDAAARVAEVIARKSRADEL